MSLKSDDSDFRKSWFWMEHGGNGDFYLNTIESVYVQGKEVKTRNSVRIAMSGGFAPHGVKMAIANLYRVMETANLNIHPKEENYE